MKSLFSILQPLSLDGFAPATNAKPGVPTALCVGLLSAAYMYM